MILASRDPLALDVAAATLIGFDWRRLNMLAGMAATADERTYSRFHGDLDEIEILSNEPSFSSVAALAGQRQHLPPSGWRNFVEASQEEQ